MTPEIALIGFGEAGTTFARAAGWGARACAYDVDVARQPAMAGCGLGIADSLRDCLADAPLILSLVTADQALAAARDAAPALEAGALWCDMNSVAPETKRAAAAIVEAAGGRYVDVAVMAPVNPVRLAVPLLLAGAAAAAALPLLGEAGFSDIRIVGERVGRASAIKLIRSVMVKGVEALNAEMMQAATAAGVADEVLASLDASEQAMPWRMRAAYNIERMVSHGQRRAAEMGEAAKALRALDTPPWMTDATIRRQADMAGQTDRLMSQLGSPA